MATKNLPINDIDLLLKILPEAVQREIARKERKKDLVEVVLDLGRPSEIRYSGNMELLSEIPVTRDDIDHVIHGVGRFTDDNRAGIERTLHRISSVRNRIGEIIGITCRVGRAVRGTVDILRDVIESGRSILLLGRPGVGKTTLLREAARVLADELLKRVIIIDTSNEIGGDGDIPHPGIGRARRMQVPLASRQHAVMIEAVENHMPEVIVIDEIGTEAEALAARTIAERGVQLIATAHGNSLENLLQNPTLADIVGGVQVVTLSDEEARRRRTRKTIMERKRPPTFSVLVEIKERDRFAVHHDVAGIVDALLEGATSKPEMRVRQTDGAITVEKYDQPRPEPTTQYGQPFPAGKHNGDNRHRKRTFRIFTYGISQIRMEKLIEKLRVPATIVSDPTRADMVITLKSQQKRHSKSLRDLQEKGVPFHVLRSNTITQMENFLREFFHLGEPLGGEESAVAEAENAAHRVINNRHPVELSPQDAHIRAIQHQLAQRFGLHTDSKGRGPYRRVVIYPR